MIVLVHPTGNANVRQAAQALNEAGLLSEFWTTVYWRRERGLNSVLPGPVAQLFNRREFPNVRRDQIRSSPWREAARLFAKRAGLTALTRHETGLLSVDAVYGSLDRTVAQRLRRKTNMSAVHAYEDGALWSFRSARQVGIKTIYELPIGYWKAYRELMVEEAESQPEWAKTLAGNNDSANKRNRKDEELALADRIIVPSEYVRSTLKKAGPLHAPISVVRYGAPPLAERPVKQVRKETGKLKIIFVGSLSQRKGLSYLLKAVEMLGSSVELTLIGARVGESSARDAACLNHRWISSLPHHEVLREIERHDVMVFPSLFEGFGLVLLEAMSCGVPVIATPNGAAPDFLTDGEDGFLVPIRSAEAIAEKVEVLIRDRERLAAMSEAAARTAARHAWESYRARLVATVRETLMSGIATPLPTPSASQPHLCNS